VRQRAHQVGEAADLDAGDVEVLDRAGGLDAVPGVLGKLQGTEGIVLDAGVMVYLGGEIA
jgi:hypothetical protein